MPRSGISPQFTHVQMLIPLVFLLSLLLAASTGYAGQPLVGDDNSTADVTQTPQEEPQRRPSNEEAGEDDKKKEADRGFDPCLFNAQLPVCASREIANGE